MVIDGRALLSCVAALLLVAASSTCKVLNEDHCANQDVPGNEFCRALNTATPYCSPCRRDFHGCVDYEPFACAGYALEQEDGSTGAQTDGSGASSGSDGDSGSSSTAG